jgi:hypothetical protein
MRAVAVRALHKAWSPGDQRVGLPHLAAVLGCGDDAEARDVLADFGVPCEVGELG